MPRPTDTRRRRCGMRYGGGGCFDEEQGALGGAESSDT
eukprot:gene20516-19925_t